VTPIDLSEHVENNWSVEQGRGRRSPPGRKPVLAARVVGRDQELGALRASMAAVKGRRGGVGFLIGEAGIGKSRLARVTRH
jgi:MoxR-like ATPase